MHSTCLLWTIFKAYRKQKARRDILDALPSRARFYWDLCLIRTRLLGVLVFPISKENARSSSSALGVGPYLA